jgi:2-C-methyl-D-erythritol 4-phosphate cytidylyltransferase
MVPPGLVTALVVAAGAGRRFGGPVPKQFLPLGGLPLLAHTLRALAVPGLVDALVVAIPPGEEAWCRGEVVAPLALPIPVLLVAGGAERQASVRAALARVEAPAELVLIHDGVRPFVPRRDLEAVIAAARAHGAAILAVPVRDTLKRAGSGAQPLCVIETVPREGLWAALTPQAFRRDLIVRAHEAAGGSAPAATDDAVLVERLGHPVALVPGARTNIKITGPDDLAIAEALLARGAGA